MARGKKSVEIPSDPTAFLLSNGFAEFVLMHSNEIVSGSKRRQRVEMIMNVWTAAVRDIVQVVQVASSHKHARSSVSLFLEIHVHDWIHLYAW
jgi:hypothetical protein